MADILQQIIALEPLARTLFMEEAFQKHRAAFLLVLSAADPARQDALYAALEGGAGSAEEVRAFFVAEMGSAAPPNPEERRTAEQELARVLGDVDGQVRDLEAANALISTQVRTYREVLKSSFVRFPGLLSDQRRGIARPPVEKAYDPQATLIALPPPAEIVLQKPNILDCIRDRKSRRQYTDQRLSLQELSYLLWATQGFRAGTPDRMRIFRTVPSGGARHPFETYLAVMRVESLAQGIYRYLPVEHKLLYLFPVEDLPTELTAGTLDQPFVGRAAVTLIWSAIPYRCEWRYTIEAKKIILQDSGHLCQNLYLACESIGCGTVAIGAYHQQLMDRLLQLDGEDEFVVYLAPVGKVESEAGGER